MTSRCNRKMVHASTIYPTQPKFDKVITCKLSQKATPQVTWPVAVAVHVRVNKIHVRNKQFTTSNFVFSHITKPHPSTQQHKGQKQIELKHQHPIKQTRSSTNPTSKLHPHKTKSSQKASQTADLNCLNFKLTVPAPKLDHTQNSCPTRSSQPPTSFLHREQDPKPVEIKI